MDFKDDLDHLAFAYVADTMPMWSLTSMFMAG